MSSPPSGVAQPAERAAHNREVVGSRPAPGTTAASSPPTTCSRSSVWPRAPGCQPGGHRFESGRERKARMPVRLGQQPSQSVAYGPRRLAERMVLRARARLAQTVRAPRSHRGGRRFESCDAHTASPAAPTKYRGTPSRRPLRGGFSRRGTHGPASPTGVVAARHPLKVMVPVQLRRGVPADGERSARPNRQVRAAQLERERVRQTRPGRGTVDPAPRPVRGQRRRVRAGAITGPRRGRAVRSARLAHNQEVVGSNPTPATRSPERHPAHALVAQRIERLITDQEVPGSSPGEGAWRARPVHGSRPQHHPQRVPRDRYAGRTRSPADSR